MMSQGFRFIVRPALFASTEGADGPRRHCRRIAAVVALALAVLATGCGPASSNGPELEPAVPPAEVARQVLASAQEAAPESELSLQDCTDWIADAAISLEPAQGPECAAMLVAAVDTCQEA